MKTPIVKLLTDKELATLFETVKSDHIRLDILIETTDRHLESLKPIVSYDYLIQRM